MSAFNSLDNIRRLTIHSSVVGLDMNLLDLSIFNLENVSLASDATENRGCVETEFQCLGELALRVT